MTEELYKNILKKIRSYKYGPGIIRAVNNLTTSFVYLTYPVFLIFLAISRDSRIWKVILVPGVSFIILSVFRSLMDLSRPYEVYDILPIINKDSKGKSFPSRHVFSVFVIAMTLYYISMPIGIALLIIGLIIGTVRVLGGVHFPRDVIAGAIIGILSGIIGWTINIF